MPNIPASGRTYSDGNLVPFPTYRCRARATFPWGAATSEPRVQTPPKHHCKLTVDHTGDHKCICNKTWRQKTEQS